MSTATWIAALATVGLALGVILAAWFARTASVALSRQLTALHELTSHLAEALQLQARELGQAHDERRRAQACRVFIELDRVIPPDLESAGGAESAGGTEPAGGAGPARVTATVRNTSDQPVYDMYVIWQIGTVRMGRPDPVARLLPAEHVCFERGPHTADGDLDAPVDPSALTAFLTFRDTAGIRWTVREDGTLSDVAPSSHA